jgi:hypothetical protein
MVERNADGQLDRLPALAPSLFAITGMSALASDMAGKRVRTERTEL